MRRLNFVVEGQTEEAFVNGVLRPHLGAFDIVATARCVTTRRDRRRPDIVHRGGLPDYGKARRDLERWAAGQGLPGHGGGEAGQDELGLQAGGTLSGAGLMVMGATRAMTRYELRISGGNPFYVRESARLLAREGALAALERVGLAGPPL